MSALGRRAPTDFTHVERYPLRALSPFDQPERTPVVIGVNWYDAFDRPVKGRDGRWRIATSGKLGRRRGGHCVCLNAYGLRDPWQWWHFYDQGAEGACVGFGWSRCMSLLNRRRYDAPWLYRQAQLRDEWADTPPEEGTSVRAGGDVLANVGAWGVGALSPAPDDGIRVYRWATNVDDVRSVLGYPATYNEVPLLNSWGTSYPHVTWIGLDVLARLLREDGEFAIPTDR